MRNFSLILCLTLVSGFTLGQSSTLSSGVLDFEGFGPVRVGMTLPEASAAAKARIESEGAGPHSECEYAAPISGPGGIGFTLVNKRIAEISIQNEAFATSTGIRVGDPERKVVETYKGKEFVGKKSVDSPRRLILVSKSASGAKVEMTFIAYEGKVSMIVAGLPVSDVPGKGCRLKN
jgi:hypothetical protein